MLTSIHLILLLIPLLIGITSSQNTTSATSTTSKGYASTSDSSMMITSSNVTMQSHASQLITTLLSTSLSSVLNSTSNPIPSATFLSSTTKESRTINVGKSLVDLKARLDKLESKNLDEKVSVIDTKIANLESGLTTIRQDLVGILKLAMKTEEKVANMSKSLQEVGTMKGTNSNTGCKCMDTTGNLTTLEKSMDQLKGNVSSLSKDLSLIASKDEQITNITQELNGLKVNLLSINSSTQNFTKSIETMKTLPLLQERTQFLEANQSDIFTKIHVISQNEKTIANIAEELKHAKADNNKSRDSTAQLNDSIKELKLTLNTVDNRIKTINSNLTTMKQDFTGLFNSKQSTDMNTTDEFKALHQKIQVLEYSYINLTTGLTQMFDKVFLTTCAVDTPNIFEGKAISFSNVKFAKGISDGLVNYIKSNGNFTCEKPGTYLVTVYIVTDTVRSSFNVLKNNKVIADAYFSMTTYYQTAAVTSVTDLQIDDVISVSPRHEYLRVFGDIESCMSIVQLA